MFAPALQGEAHAKATWSFDTPNAYEEDETRVNEFLLKDKLQGPTVGVGTRVRYGDNDHGVTLDVTYSKTHLNGSVRWNSEGFWEDGSAGSARYSYDVQKYNALLGYELTLKGPLFGFAQAGIQYMPEQTSNMTQTGAVPQFDDEDGFQDDVSERRLTEIDRQVTFQGELQYGLGAGVGVRF